MGDGIDRASASAGSSRVPSSTSSMRPRIVSRSAATRRQEARVAVGNEASSTRAGQLGRGERASHPRARARQHVMGVREQQSRRLGSGCPWPRRSISVRPASRPVPKLSGSPSPGGERGRGRRTRSRARRPRAGSAGGGCRA
jgi:hypothetical protein